MKARISYGGKEGTRNERGVTLITVTRRRRKLKSSVTSLGGLINEARGETRRQRRQSLEREDWESEKGVVICRLVKRETELTGGEGRGQSRSPHGHEAKGGVDLLVRS